MLQQTLRQVGANPGVNFWSLGYVPDEDLGGLFAGAIASVVASTSEGDVSGPIFLSLRAKTPLIFSDLPVFIESLGSTNAFGIDFPVGNYRILGETLIHVCEQPEDSKLRAERAYELSLQRTLEHVTADYLAAFEEAIHHEKHSPDS
jgi:hypothetical protein